MSVTINNFGASGASHSSGVVPDPGSTAGTSRFLREDSTWVAPGNGENFFVDIASQCATASGFGWPPPLVQLTAGGNAILSVPAGYSVDGKVFHVKFAYFGNGDGTNNYTMFLNVTSIASLATTAAPSSISVVGGFVDIECFWSSATQLMYYTVAGGTLASTNVSPVSISSAGDVNFSIAVGSSGGPNSCSLTVTQFSLEV
jgi:hypothetical protein